MIFLLRPRDYPFTLSGEKRFPAFDVLLKIFDYLSITDLSAVSLTCWSGKRVTDVSLTKRAIDLGLDAPNPDAVEAKTFLSTLLKVARCIPLNFVMKTREVKIFNLFKVNIERGYDWERSLQKFAKFPAWKMIYYYARLSNATFFTFNRIRDFHLFLRKQRELFPQENIDDETYLIRALREAVNHCDDQAVALLISLWGSLKLYRNVKESALSDACVKGSYEICLSLLEWGADPNYTARDNSTPLQRAASLGHLRIMELLLSKGANPNNFALHTAATHGNLRGIELLLEWGAEINARGGTGQTPLIYAINNNRTKAVRMLLINGADVDIADNQGKTPLGYAYNSLRFSEIVPLLLEFRADPLSPISPFPEASMRGRKWIKELLDVGVTVNARNEKGETALLLSARNAHLDSVKFLLEQGADPDLPCDNGLTPLACALSRKHFQVAAVLIKAGANPNTPDRCRPLQFAAETGRTDIIELLLDHGAAIDGLSEPVQLPAIYYAVKNGELEAVKLLIARGANINLPNRVESLLHLAVEKRFLECIEPLLEVGADINCRGLEGETPLFRAVKCNFLETVKILLAKGANPNLKDKDGWTPLLWAFESRREQMIPLLIQSDIDPNIRAPTSSGRQALHYAALRGNTEDIITLLLKGADVHSKAWEPGGHKPSNMTSNPKVRGLLKLNEGIRPPDVHIAD